MHVVPYWQAKPPDEVNKRLETTTAPVDNDATGGGERRLGTLAVVYLAERSRRRELSPHTVKGYRSALDLLVAHFGYDKLPTRLTQQRLENWLAKSPSDATYRVRLSIARGFCWWLVDNKYLKTNPLARVSGPRQVRYLPRHLRSGEPTLAIDAARDERTTLCVVLMVQEGLRRGEVARLQIGDVDLIDGTLHVVGKGGHEREIALTDEAAAAIRAYLAVCPATSGPLIRSTAKPRLGVKPQRIGELVKEALVSAGLGEATPHQLRHTAAHDVLDGGANLRDVQTMLGHANLSTTSRYVGLSSLGDLRKAMNGRQYKRVSRPVRKSVGPDDAA